MHQSVLIFVFPFREFSPAFYWPSQSLPESCEKCALVPGDGFECRVEHPSGNKGEKRSRSAKSAGRWKGHNQHIMAKDVIHISDAEAVSDFAAILDRVSAGTEVIIERDSRPVAVLRKAEAPRGRLLSESIALAEAHAKELGYEPTMDADFAADLREIINGRKPRDLPAWD